MKIGIGADPYGVELKQVIKAHLLAGEYECVDFGGNPEHQRAYYEVAHELATKISAGQLDRGILICGTGMGMAIIANKHSGVYAAVCEEPSTAAKARSINNANVLTLGGMLTAPFKAKEITDVFLSTDFRSGWDASIQAFLDQSMIDIHQIEVEAFQVNST
jgi:ribose 5-phosphate isomerase B